MEVGAGTRLARARTRGSRAAAANALVVSSAEDRPWMGERAERLERRLEWPMLVVAALVIPALILEGANVGHGWKALANVLNWIIWLAFLGELVAMLAVVRERGAYLRHNPLNVAIVVLTPPFLPALLQSFRALRLVRGASSKCAVA